MSLQYSQRLRSIENFQNTITINSENYLDIINRLERQTERDFRVWRNYADREFQRFQRQIQADLNYLHQGSRLLDTAIAIIRGLVEIDQAERDRQIEANNQQLQDHFQAIGVGIAAGAIVASTSGLIFQEKITYPWQQNHGKQLHPFTIGVLLSVACAVGFWFVCWAILKCRRK